jgi:4-hydroxy-tetrahydrodipicolinate synthase
LRASVDVPIFVYNETAVSGNAIELETLVRICGLPGVVGIKESSGSPAFTRQLVTAGTGVPVFEGWENLLLESAGVAGFIGPLASLEPGLCNRMLAAPSAELQKEIDEQCERLGIFRDDWYRWVKKALHERGILSSDLVVDEERTDRGDGNAQR